MDLEGLIEHLYDLQPQELRRLAYEALLISDGVDRVDQENWKVQSACALEHLQELFSNGT